MTGPRIAGLVLLETRTFSDHRGYFRETYRQDRLTEILGRRVDFTQDNESWSKSAGVLRGLHFQRPPHVQAKLVRVVRGAVFDVAVDLRAGSPTYGRWEGFELTADNGRQLFVPEGLAHGFVTLVDDTVVSYKTSDFYAPECEGGLRWNDPDLAIDWPLKGREPIVSEKDGLLPFFSQSVPFEK